MPIDRGPWTALVDDDGSNTIGTIWNKDKIKTTILDPVDAALVADVSEAWKAIPFVATNFKTYEGTNLTFPAGNPNNRWRKIGSNLIVWEFYSAQVSIPAVTPLLVFSGLPFTMANAFQAFPVAMMHPPGNVSFAGASSFYVQRNDATSHAVGVIRVAFLTVLEGAAV